MMFSKWRGGCDHDPNVLLVGACESIYFELFFYQLQD